MSDNDYEQVSLPEIKDPNSISQDLSKSVQPPLVTIKEKLEGSSQLKQKNVDTSKQSLEVKTKSLQSYVESIDEDEMYGEPKILQYSDLSEEILQKLADAEKAENIIHKQLSLQEEIGDYQGLMGIPLSIIQFEEYQSGEVVFRYGDVGDKFYVIIKGQITVHTKNPNIQNWDKEYKILCKIKEEKKDAQKMEHKKNLVEQRRQ